MAKKKAGEAGEMAATPPVKELTLGDLIREAVLRGGVDRKSNAGIAEYIRRVHPDYKFADTSIASTKAKALAESTKGESAPASAHTPTPAKRVGRPPRESAPDKRPGRPPGASLADGPSEPNPTSSLLLTLHQLVGTDLAGATEAVARVRKMLETIPGEAEPKFVFLEKELDVLRKLSGTGGEGK